MPPVPPDRHLLRARDLIDMRFAEPLDLDALARAAHVSRWHFVRAFRRVFGETPHQYLLKRRIERAKELLRETDRSVTEVSLDVGFRSLGSFSTAFRDLVGEPPSEYSRRWRSASPPAIPGCFSMMHTRPMKRAALEKTSPPATPSVPGASDAGGRDR
jgi:AraC-like DNA-binding protein